MSEEEKRAWDRLPGESSKAYHHFCLYRDMGASRSLRKMAKDGVCGAKLGQLERWSSNWRWVERCQKYDDYLDYQDRLQQEKDRREMHKRHAKMGMLAQSLAVRKLEKMANRIEQDEERVPPGEAARILDIGVKVERQARGESSDSSSMVPLAEVMTLFGEMVQILKERITDKRILNDILIDVEKLSSVPNQASLAPADGMRQSPTPRPLPRASLGFREGGRRHRL